MAYIFREGKMASNVLDSMLANAKAEVALKDGSLVKLGELVKNDVYGDVDYDTYAATLPAGATDEVVIVDYAGISEGKIAGNVYRIGNKLHDIEIPAGEIVRVRRLALHDKFWLGEGNFEGKVAVKAEAIAKASTGAHVIVDEENTDTGSGYKVKIIAERELTAGMKAEGKLYLCEVVRL